VRKMRKDEIKSRVAEVRNWYHKIDLGHGVVTPGYSHSWEFDRLNLPDLSGRSVLDVGCWDGFFSFECEKRGAEKVLATDHVAWTYADGMRGFLNAREILGSEIEYKDIDVFDISPETVGTWDIVLFLGVLYHLKNPMLALERLARVTKSLLVVESHILVMPYSDDVPLMAFYETNELNRDSSNWWGPNIECLSGMARSAGFELAELQATTTGNRERGGYRPRRRELLRQLWESFFGSGSSFYAAEHRAIIHAWKSEEQKQLLTSGEAPRDHHKQTE
jgi:tRNA (mo5U34)-methyltransferase